MADESAAVVAPVAAPVEQAAPVTKEAAKAHALGLVAQGDTQPVEAAAPTDPWEPKIPQVKPQSARERILAKQAAQQAAAQANTLQSQFEQLKGQYEQLTSGEQRANAQFSKLLEEGNVQEALKVKGLSVSFEELQRAELKRRGAISDVPRDPRVDALESKLKGYEEAEQKRQEMIRQRQEQQAKAKEWQDGIAAVKTELAASQLPGAAALTEVAGFNDAVLQVMMRDPNIELENAAAIVRRDFEAFFKQMLPVFQAQQAAAQQPARQAPGAKSPADRVGAVRRAPTPQQAITGKLTPNELRAMALKKVITGRT